MELIDYLKGYLKCEWMLKENSLALSCDCFSYSFIDKVNELKPIAYLDTSTAGMLTICFNLTGIRHDPSKIIHHGNKPK